MLQAEIAVPHIACRPILGRDACTGNVRRNRALGLPRLQDLPEMGRPKTGPIALVGGGPSLGGQIEVLRKFRTIMSCSSVHDYLVENLVRPRYAVIMDPVASGNLHYFDWQVPSCTYLVASHVEAAVLDKLKGRKIALWHLMGDSDEDAFGDELQIMGGCTAMLRASIIAFYMGYTDQHFFGMDSCYSGFEPYAYPVGEPMPDAVRIKVGSDREFLTNAAWVAQAQQFFRAIEVTRGAIRPTLHGDGLIAEMVRKGNPDLHKYITLA